MRALIITFFLALFNSSFADECNNKCGIELRVTLKASQKIFFDYTTTFPDENIYSCNPSEHNEITISTYSSKKHSLLKFKESSTNNGKTEYGCNYFYENIVEIDKPYVLSESEECEECDIRYEMYQELIVSLYDGHAELGMDDNDNFRLPSNRELDIYKTSLYQYYNPACTYYTDFKGILISSFPLSNPESILPGISFPLDLDLSDQLDGMYIYIYDSSNYKILETIQIEKYEPGIIKSFLEASCNNETKLKQESAKRNSSPQSRNRHVLER